MKNIKLYLLLLVAGAFTFYSCEDELEPLNTNFVTFGDSNYSTTVDPGSTTTVSIPVYTANVKGSDRTFNVSVDGSAAPAGSYNVPATVTVPGGTNEGVLNVQLNDPQNILTNYLSVQFVAEDGLFVGEATTIAFAQSCNEVALTLDFTFDYWSSETSWEILDAVGDTVVAGGGYGDGIGVASESFNLCQGRDYTLVVYDAYGDGMNDGQNPIGTYTLSLGGNVLVQELGDFGASRSTAFSTN